MFKIKSATRLAITIGFMCATIIWMALGIGLIPNPKAAAIQKRVDVTKAIAVTVSSYAENRRYLELEQILKRNIAIDGNILSIGIRRQTGNYLLHVGPHLENWKNEAFESSNQNQINVDILANGRKWGQLELAFVQAPEGFWRTMVGYPYGLISFLTCSMILFTWFVLGRTFKYLNPAKVVPNRVRTALDSLASGLVLVTNSGEIAHANKAFGIISQREVDEIVGQRLDDFDWRLGDEDDTEFPWVKTQKFLTAVSGQIVESGMAEGVKQKYMVNATPIFGSKEQSRGVLVSFEDVTALESKKTELSRIIQTVRMSRDEVERQNEQLSFLASYDSLTKCMNRRAFFAQYEQLWLESENQNLTVIMLDIDHFKAVNDNHGHSAGDEVLAKIGEILQDTVGQNGLVCRYGGEEFVVLLRDMDLNQCADYAEQIRHNIQAEAIAGLMITASLGLSNRAGGAMDAQHMLDQADQCLYAAKRNGRNQLIRFDHCPAIIADEFEPETGETDSDSDQQAPKANDEIEFSAVTGLLSALSFRSPATAEHSVRVADLAVAIGESLMTHRELYRLEIAALLHDVGKIGVPDAILNKPGSLSAEEWEIMQRHNEIGVAIVRSAFASEEVAQTIERHHNCSSSQNISVLAEHKTTMSFRILKVCDAFDSIVSDQVYRKGLSSDEALNEILQNTPAQFDMLVVNQLIEHVKSGRFDEQRLQNQTQNHGLNAGPEPTVAIINERADALCAAIADDNLDQIGEAVANLKADSLKSVAETTSSKTDHDYEKLLTLADEVIGLCNATRTTFRENSDSVDLTEEASATSQPQTR